MRIREHITHELSVAKRTWWLTLTFDPVVYGGICIQANQMPDSMPWERRLWRASYPHVQAWLKRMRSERCTIRNDDGKTRKLGFKLRYYVVFELGEERGRGHFHLLVHEHGSRPIPKEILEFSWPGIVHARLVDTARKGLASYVSKYATKTLHSTYRASRGYGKYDPVSRPAGKDTETPLPNVENTAPRQWSSLLPNRPQDGSLAGEPRFEISQGVRGMQSPGFHGEETDECQCADCQNHARENEARVQQERRHIQPGAPEVPPARRE